MKCFKYNNKKYKLKKEKVQKRKRENRKPEKQLPPLLQKASTISLSLHFLLVSKYKILHPNHHHHHHCFLHTKKPLLFNPFKRSPSHRIFFRTLTSLFGESIRKKLFQFFFSIGIFISFLIFRGSSNFLSHSVINSCPFCSPQTSQIYFSPKYFFCNNVF